MTKDWLDFSVEHISMWLTLVEGPGDSQQAIDRAIGILKNYTLSRPVLGVGLLISQETLVVISYQERTNKELSKWLFAATISSHVSAGMGRIIVSGVLTEEEDLVQQVFYVIQSQFGHDSPELSFCPALNEVTGENGYININRTALKKLRLVLLGKTTDSDVKCWLGETTVTKILQAQKHEPIIRNKWKYVYFTESDLLITTCLSSLMALGMKLKDGFVLAPHRLQPLPHGIDFGDTDIDKTCIIPATGLFEQVNLTAMRFVVILDPSNQCRCLNHQKPGGGKMDLIKLGRTQIWCQKLHTRG